jgi:diadenosine tetraphosphate (Ap4A) HIT family hydrolase
MTDCLTCTLLARRDAGGAPVWDAIARTDHWDVVHAYDTSIEGWLVLAARRHLTALADLSDAEAAELGPLTRDVSRALHAALGCEKTYVAQFAEAAAHPHVHVHVVPRAVEWPDALRGPRVFAALGVPEDERVPEARRDEIARAVRAELADRTLSGRRPR